MKPTGPKPKPTTLKLLEGNPGRRPIGPTAGEPAPRPALPKAPKTLTSEAQKEYRRLGKQLLSYGLVTELDRDALALLAQTWVDWAEANDRVHEKGPVVISQNGFPMLTPWYTVAQQLQKQLANQLQEFGLSPSSRTRVKAATADEGSPLDKFLQPRKRRGVARS